MSEINNLQMYEITPSGRSDFNLSEILKYKDLLYILIWRNIKVRYKQTVMGVAWVIFQPLLSMIIFTIFFGKLAKIPSDSIPYPVFVYAGLIFWNYFNMALLGSLNSLIESQNIIKKIYFPRELVILSATITPIVDFLLVYIIFFGLMAVYHFLPHFVGFLWVPYLLFLSFLTATGLGFLLSSINVRYRDVNYILSFFVQILFFITPIIYPISIIPANFQWVIYLNPMAGVVILTRSFLLGATIPDWRLLLSSSVISLILFVAGLRYYIKAQKYFADEI